MQSLDSTSFLPLRHCCQCELPPVEASMSTSLDSDPCLLQYVPVLRSQALRPIFQGLLNPGSTKYPERSCQLQISWLWSVPAQVPCSDHVPFHTIRALYLPQAFVESFLGGFQQARQRFEHPKFLQLDPPISLRVLVYDQWATDKTIFARFADR